jgi:hypothetical protein
MEKDVGLAHIIWYGSNQSKWNLEFGIRKIRSLYRTGSLH